MRHAMWPNRKRLNHRGPLSIDAASAWYFITICAEGHRPWATQTAPDAILSTAHHFHNIGKWRLALFLVMPDHVHFIVNIPPDDGGMGLHDGAMGSSRPTTDAPVGRHDPMPPFARVDGAMGASRPTGLDRVVRDFKRSVSRLFKIRFQRDFFDTRLRDAAHFAEKHAYILDNPVRKGLCATPEEWPYVVAFNRETGEHNAMGSSSPTDDASVGRHDLMPPPTHGAMGSSSPTDDVFWQSRTRAG